MTQTVVSLNTTMNVVAPNPYDAVAVTFIAQKNRNNLYCDGNMCEYLVDIDRVEFTLNNQSYGPITYTIGAGASPPYQDLALNALKSLKGNPEKNSIMNRILQENGCFVMGMSYAANQNDKLGITMQIDSATQFQYSANPFNALLYINGYATL